MLSRSPPPPPPPTHQIRLWWNKVSLGLHDTQSFIDTAYFNTDWDLTLHLQSLVIKHYFFILSDSSVSVGPRAQGQTVLIQIPLSGCVTNNPIQNSSLSRLARLQQIFTLQGREACLNLPAGSIGGTWVYTVFIIEWNEQCKYELISSLQLHYHTLNSGLTMVMFTFHISPYLLSTFPQFSKVTPTSCLLCAQSFLLEI